VCEAKLNAVTIDNEQVPAEVLMQLREHGLNLHPSPDAVFLMQDKTRQKAWLASLGVPCPKQIFTGTVSEFLKKNVAPRYPVCMKSAQGGYDGKGVWILSDRDDALETLLRLPKGLQVVVEEYVNISKEYSLVFCKDIFGTVKYYPVIENQHRGGILEYSVCPAQICEKTRRIIEVCGAAVAQKLNTLGVCCIEFMEDTNGILFANEMCVRPHNSAHLTIEGAVTGQFEQHIRSIMGLPVGSTRVFRPAVMVNILGTADAAAITCDGLGQVLQEESVYLHLYGKTGMKENRKIGHITVLDETETLAQQKAERAINSLTIREASGE